MEEAKGCERIRRTEDKDKLLSSFSSKNMRSGEIYLGYLDQEMCLQGSIQCWLSHTSFRHYIIIVELVEEIESHVHVPNKSTTTTTLTRVFDWRHIFGWRQK